MKKSNIKKAIYLTLAILIFYILIHFGLKSVMSSLAENFKELNKWILTQNFFVKFSVYFFAMLPIELLCVPGTTLFLVTSSFYLKNFWSSLILF